MAVCLLTGSYDLNVPSWLVNRAQMTGFDDDSHSLELQGIVVACIQHLKKDGRPDTRMSPRMSPSRLYVPAKPSKHGRRSWGR